MTTAVGKELGSIARALSMAKDAVDALFDELFPDTTTALIERWERAVGIGPVPSDSLPVRRTRVVAALRRVNGPHISQLEQMLAPVLDCLVSDLIWVEPLRSFIDEALTETTGTVALSVPTSPPGLSVRLGKPLPGVIDDTGVRVYLALSSIGVTTATLTHPDGTVWTIPVNATSGWYWDRTTFIGKPAAGVWTVNIRDSSAPTLTEARLLVSDNVDSGQIYNFYLVRDADLGGAPDLITAQKLFKATALAHNRAFIVERSALIHGDSHSLMGREPMGA